MLTILAKDGRGEEVLQNLAVLLKRTFHFLPGHELVHLLGQLPEFLPNKARHQTLTASLMSQHSADVHSTNARKLRTADFLILHSLHTERVCINGLYLYAAIAMLSQQFPQQLCN